MLPSRVSTGHSKVVYVSIRSFVTTAERKILRFRGLQIKPSLCRSLLNRCERIAEASQMSEDGRINRVCAGHKKPAVLVTSVTRADNCEVTATPIID